MPFYFALSLWNNGMLECWNGGGKRGKKPFICQQMPIIPSNPSFPYSITPIFQVRGEAEPSLYFCNFDNAVSVSWNSPPEGDHIHLRPHIQDFQVLNGGSLVSHPSREFLPFVDPSRSGT